MNRFLPRSLFARVFFAFVLAMVLAAAGFFSVTFAVQKDPLIARSYVNSSGLMALCARNVAERYERGGAPAAQAEMREIEQATKLALTLLDGRGQRRLAGEPLTRAGQRAAQMTARGPVDTPLSIPYQLLTAVSVACPSGERYVLVGQMPGGLTRNLYAPIARTMMVLLMASLVCAGLARSVTRPLEAVRAAAHRLASGDLTARAGLATTINGNGDEITELGRDFDTMASRLEDAVKAQQQLLADISHELRSPLARLNVALELARQRTGAGPATGPLDRIERETHRMNVLIGELIALTRMEIEPEARERSLVDLDSLARSVCEDADYEATARGCRVELTYAEPLTLPGEEELLRRALENIVRNAVRYTAEGTTVTVTLQKEAGNAVLLVRDHGPGVPEEHLSDLWRPFFRVEDARDRSSGGLGLGLAIAERAVRLHGSTVAATNAPDGGLIVSVTLPLR